MCERQLRLEDTAVAKEATIGATPVEDAPIAIAGVPVHVRDGAADDGEEVGVSVVKQIAVFPVRLPPRHHVDGIARRFRRVLAAGISDDFGYHRVVFQIAVGERELSYWPRRCVLAHVLDEAVVDVYALARRKRRVRIVVLRCGNECRADLPQN